MSLSNQGNVAVETDREVQVVSQQNQLQGALEGRHNSLSELEGRLQKVLLDEPPEEAKGVAEEVLVPLAAELRGHLAEINRASERVRSVLSRLEL